ncbi:MAG TPA: hypothetical protein VFR49_07735, partial [Solirubrobacteraceae bacterium]|nr:hypothetical protein [Solirubrobacteraceae bacterium]
DTPAMVVRAAVRLGGSWRVHRVGPGGGSVAATMADDGAAVVTYDQTTPPTGNRSQVVAWALTQGSGEPPPLRVIARSGLTWPPQALVAGDLLVVAWQNLDNTTSASVAPLGRPLPVASVISPGGTGGEAQLSPTLSVSPAGTVLARTVDPNGDRLLQARLLTG